MTSVTRLRSLSFIVAIVVGTVIAACGRKSDEYRSDSVAAGGDVALPPGDSTSGMATSGSMDLPTTDGGAVDVESAIDQSEVEAAQLALGKAQNAEVKRFAQDMLDAHSKDKSAVEQLAQHAAITGTGAGGIGILTTMQSSHQQTMDHLRQETGDGFDNAYVNAMVTGHQQALDVFQRVEHSVQNAELQQHISQVIPVVQKHLDGARELQRTLLRVNSQ